MIQYISTIQYQEALILKDFLANLDKYCGIISILKKFINFMCHTSLSPILIVITFSSWRSNSKEEWDSWSSSTCKVYLLKSLGIKEPIDAIASMNQLEDLEVASILNLSNNFNKLSAKALYFYNKGSLHWKVLWFDLRPIKNL